MVRLLWSPRLRPKPTSRAMRPTRASMSLGETTMDGSHSGACPTAPPHEHAI